MNAETSKTDVNEYDEEDFERYIHCPCCGGKMWYDPREENYTCEDCGNHAFYYGSTLYFEHDPDDDYDEYYDDIPEGCAACGGDYPNCTSSCNLMSD